MPDPRNAPSRLDIAGGRVSVIRSVINRGKLRHFAPPATSAACAASSGSRTDQHAAQLARTQPDPRTQPD